MKRPKSTKIIESDSSSGSESEEEWNSRAKRAKRVGVESSSSDGSSPSEPEEGELSSDGQDEDDGLDEDLMGDEADRLRLAEMTEKEREEELFKRAEQREAMKARRSVKEKLREGRRRQQLMKEKEREKKRSQAAPKARAEAPRSSGSSSANAAGGTSRQKALEEKRGGANKFAQLIERRKAKLKTSEIFSDEDDESSSSSSSGSDSEGGSDAEQRKKERREKKKKAAAGAKERTREGRSRIMRHRRDSSAGSSSSSKDKAAVRSSSSRSSSRSSSSRSRSRSRSSSAAVVSEDGECRRSDSSDDDGSGNGAWPGRGSRKNALIENREELMRARLSRFKMEKWVHMPFFKDLVIGCFVRVGIGNKDGHAIYRIAQIEDVVETGKIYDLGTTRTNRGLILRHGEDRQMFRLCFLSNQDFSPSEWDKWLMSMSAASLTLPTHAFVMKKEEEIARATEHRIENDAELERILDEKRRFRRGPLNYTLQKIELMKDRQLAENEGDSSRVARITMEMTDLESEANERERKRTMQIKSISYINERNRAQNLKLAEEASKREFEEMEQMQKNGMTDPFSRLQTRPVLFGTKRKTTAPNDQTQQQPQQQQPQQPQQPQQQPSSQQPQQQRPQSRPLRAPVKQVREHSNHRASEKAGNGANDGESGGGDVFSIHNFDINIDIDMPMSAPLPPSVPVSSVSASTGIVAVAATDLSTPPTLGTSRRGLNLEEYKKRRGLI